MIATILFGAFSVLAFSGLFPLIESQFFSPRVIQDVQKNLTAGQSAEDAWSQRIRESFRLLMEKDYFKGVFNPVQSRESLENQINDVRLYLRGFRGQASIRVTDVALQRVHFSTLSEDRLTSTDTMVSYRDYLPGDNWPEALTLRKEVTDRTEAYFPKEEAVVFSMVLKDSSTQATLGIAFLSVPIEDLSEELFQKGLLAHRNFFRRLDNDLRVVSHTSLLSETLLAELAASQARAMTTPVRYLTDGENRLVTIQGERELLNWIAVLPADSLILGDTTKAIILFSVFTLLFLPVFILFNLKPEPEVIWRRKIKAIQIQVLSEYMDKGIDGAESARQLALNKLEVKDQLRRAIGKVSKKKEPLVEALIDAGWETVLGVLGVQGPAPPPITPSVDLSRLEKLLSEALSKGALGVSAPSPSLRPHDQATKTGGKSSVSKTSEDPEEVEELEEIGEAEELEAVEELEEIGEAEELEAVEELEEIGEAEELEAVEDLEEIGGAEELEAVEELEEIAEVEELEAVEELEEALSVEVPEGDLDLREDLEFLVPQEDQSSSGLPLEPVSSGQDFYLYPPISTGKAEVKEALKVIGDGDLIPLEEEGGSTPEDRQIKSFSLEEMSSYYSGLTAGYMEEEEGVFTIRNEAFQQPSGPKDRDFGDLVASVLTSSSGPQTFVLELEGDRPADKLWKWTDDGFDLDLLLKGYREGDIGLYKAMVDLSSLFGAVGVGLLVRQDDSYALGHSVGFSDQGKQFFKLPADNSFVQRYLDRGGLHLVDLRYHNSPLRRFFAEKDLKFITTVCFVPLRWKGQREYLLFAGRSYPTKILDVLAPRMNIQ